MLGLGGKEGSGLPQGWSVVSKGLFLPALIAGSFTEAPRGRAAVCSVPLRHFMLRWPTGPFSPSLFSS